MTWSHGGQQVHIRQLLPVSSCSVPVNKNPSCLAGPNNNNKPTHLSELLLVIGGQDSSAHTGPIH